MGAPFLLICVAGSLIAVKNESGLLLALVISKDSVPIVEYNVKMLNCWYLDLTGILTTKAVNESLFIEDTNLKLSILNLITQSKN